MTIALAPALPASPVTDGTMTAAGQTAAPATGFDALLALIDAMIIGAPVAGEPRIGNDQETADPTAAVIDGAPPLPAPLSDPMLTSLAALMLPAAPLAEATAPAAAATAPAAALPVHSDFAPMAPVPTGPVPAAAKAGPDATIATPPALTAPAEVAAPFTLAAAPAAAAPAPVTPMAAAPAPVTATSALPTPPAPAASLAVADTARTDAPARPAAAAPPAGPAAPTGDAVRTETPDAVAAIAPDAGKAATGQAAAQPAAQAETAAPIAAGAPAATSAAATPTPVRVADTLAPVAEAVAVVRGSPDTVARLSADILRKLDGRSTRFEIALDPLGLGRVDVKMEIGAHGQVTAALSFDTAHAAAELRGRASELRHALQQAGFDLPDNALSFDVGSQAGGDGRGAHTAWDMQERGRGRGSAGHAFEAVLNGGESLLSDLSTRLGAPRADGVDVRI